MGILDGLTSRTKIQVLGDERIFDRAIALLRQESESDQPSLLRWASGEFERTYDIHLSNLIDADDDYQTLGDMILENPRMKYWLRAGNIDRPSVLRAETFRDLIDQLTPIRRWD